MKNKTLSGVETGFGGYHLDLGLVSIILCKPGTTVLVQLWSVKMMV